MDKREIVYLDPNDILADSNTRFGLKDSRLERLMDQILNDGGVNTPVEVEQLDPPVTVDGIEKHYRLTVGFYRHGSVSKLNDEKGAGLFLPAIVRPMPDSTTRIKRQLSENMERENQSPMDQAVAIKALLDAGVTKQDVRVIFARPGSRRGTGLLPASNSFVNMTLSFLELPKAIQKKIHDGLVGVAAAYELTKVPVEKRADVLAAAEKERIAAIEADEKQEAKYMEDERKAAEAKQKEEELTRQLEVAKTEAAEAAKIAKAKIEEEAEALKASRQKVTGADAATIAAAKKAAAEALAKAKADATAATKEHEAKEKEAAKLEEKRQAQEKKAKEVADKLAAARQAARAGRGAGSNASSQDIKRAAAEAAKAAGNGGSQPVALNVAEVRKSVAELCLEGAYPKVKLIGDILSKHIQGISTFPQMYTALAKVTGEYKPGAGRNRTAQPAADASAT